MYLLLCTRTKKGQKANGIPKVLISNQNTINFAVKTVWRCALVALHEPISCKILKTSNIRLQNIQSVYLSISLQKKTNKLNWLLTGLKLRGRPFWFMIILIYWSLRLSIRILFSSLAIKNGIPVPSWWVTGLFNSRGSKSDTPRAEGSHLLRCGTGLIL